MRCIALEFETGSDFSENFTKLCDLLQRCEKGDLVVAPEVALTGFCYERMDEAVTFGESARNTLLHLTKKGEFTLVLTFIIRGQKGYENRAYVFSHGEVIYERSKSKLFLLGREDEYFVAGDFSESLVFELYGKKIGVLICFELRFIEMWEKMGKVDAIAVMAMWGKNRKDHFVTLCNALALTKQCYVLASSSCNHNMAGESAIIDPWGERTKGEMAVLPFDPKRIELTRRQIQL